MKKLLFGIICTLYCLQGWGFAQQEEVSLIEEPVQTQGESSCITPFSLDGAEYAFIGETLYYTLESPFEENSDSISYSLQLKDGNKLIQKTQNQSLQITFGEIGSFILSVDIKQGNCSYFLEKNISVFEKAVVYIGEPQEAFQLGFEQNFSEQDVLFYPIFLESNKLGNEEEIRGFLRKELRFFNHADTIIIKDGNFDGILYAFSEFLQQDILTKVERNIFVVSNYNRSFLNRVLSIFIAQLPQQQLATVRNSDFLNVLTLLSLGKSLEEVQNFTSFHTLQQAQGPGVMLISYLVDQAITKGISLTIIAILLLIPLIALLISFFRQIVGLSVFGVYQPLLLAVSIFFIGWKIALFLLGIAAISTFLVRIFSKRIIFLQSTKISLLIGLYVVLLLGGFWVSQFGGFEIIKNSAFSNSFIIFPIFIALMVCDKLFTEHFNLSKKSGRVAIVEFVIITSISRFILERQLMKNLFLSYPELVLGVIVLLVIVGRFRGLQIFELLRFMPLIKKHLEDEEE